MFNKNLGICKLTDNDSHSFFGNITGYQNWSFRNDYTFLAVARALLFKRMKGEEKFGVTVTSVSWDKRAIDSTSNQTVCNVIAGPGDARNCVKLVNYNGDNDGAEALFAVLDSPESGLVKCMVDYEEQTDLREFVKKYMDARFYVSKSRHATLIVVKNMDLRTYHMTCALFPRYISWYLKDAPLDDTEKELCGSLTDRFPVKYEEALAKIIDGIDFRSGRIRRMIEGLERRSRQKQLDDAMEDVDTLSSRIRRTLDDYKTLFLERERRKIDVEGLRVMLDRVSDDSELMQYLIHNKHVELIGASDFRIDVIVDTYLDVFDIEQFNRIARNKGSILYTGYDYESLGVFRDREKREKILRAIFSEEPLLRIKTCAEFKIDIRGHEVTVGRHYSYPDAYADMMPNTHLDEFQCLGQNLPVMLDRLQNGDVVGCLMQCIAATKCLNMSDSVVVRQFAYRLFNNDWKIIEMPDGTSATVKEALAWLEQRESDAQSAQTEEHNDEDTQSQDEG